MFGYKSAGIVKQAWNALSFETFRSGRGAAWHVHNPRSQASQGPVARNDTYIAPPQLTVVSMPFFRWSQ